MRRLVTAACAVVAAGIGAGAAFAMTGGAAPAVPGVSSDTTVSSGNAVPVTVTGSSCGQNAGWHLAAGPATFDVTSHAPGFTSVYLVSAATSPGSVPGSQGGVLGELPSVGTGRTSPLSATLTRGRYTLRCVLTDATVRVSGPIQVSGTAAGAARGYRPMTSLALTAPVQAFTAWVTKQLPGLLTACRRLDADVARGDLTAARSDWLTAHLDYERLGAAYNAFGDFDPKIDGMAGGLPEGTATPGWTGFFAIEHALFGGAPAARLRPLTRGLVSAVAGLITEFPSDEIDPGDLPLRTHEILENTLEFQLAGTADYGSGTTLATAYANTQGTGELLGTLTPLLRSLAPPVLTEARRELAVLRRDLLAQRAADGRWTPVARLTSAARDRLDGDFGTLLETLSQVPGILTPRNGA